jgi:hypothetical protein
MEQEGRESPRPIAGIGKAQSKIEDAEKALGTSQLEMAMPSIRPEKIALRIVHAPRI